MATAAYINGRRKYQRPQAMLWSNNPGTLVESPTLEEPNRKMYVPSGFEIGSDAGIVTDTSLSDEFLILSDDNRSPIDFKPSRIEIRERMINGRMRSYHVADKLQISTSWDMLPSRSFAIKPDFGSTGKSDMTGQRGMVRYPDMEYTTDGGAGGAELFDWYNNHPGSFWVFLAYDNYPNFGKDNDAYGHLDQYNEVIEVFFSDFSYSVQKRGGSNHDFWNVSVSLEEA
jgi:hypothetical protein